MEHNLSYRLADESDIKKIVEMLFDDPLGVAREIKGIIVFDTYTRAFNRIKADPNQELTVVELDGKVVGTYQLTYIQYLTHQGGLRAQIEAVRVASEWRGKGIGRQMFAYASEQAKSKGCYIMQLTTDKRRPEALKFYESIGYVATHEGMKLKL